MKSLFLLLPLALGACAGTFDTVQATKNITTVCADYDVAKAVVGFVPVPQVQLAATAIEIFVNPICDGGAGAIEKDVNTVAWVVHNIEMLKALNAPKAV